MKWIIVGERSGIIRDALTAKGHDATSCDLYESDSDGQHIIVKNDKQLKRMLYSRNRVRYDAMIAHPPCTVLTSAGQWYYKDKPELVQKGVDFFMMLINAPVKRRCIENPAGIMTARYRKPDQYIHPYYFGEPHMKRTGLWLFNLPKLTHPPSRGLKKPDPVYVQKNGKKLYFTDALCAGSGVFRSRTFPVIAQAMADQWNF